MYFLCNSGGGKKPVQSTISSDVDMENLIAFQATNLLYCKKKKEEEKKGRILTVLNIIFL